MSAERTREDWVKHRSLGRRHTDRKWPRHLRDFWMLVITGLVVYALSVFSGTQDSQQATLSRLDKDRQALATQQASLTKLDKDRQAALAAQQITLGKLDKDRRALCSLRDDLSKRVDQGNAFLATHPHGIPGIPASTLRVSIANQQHTLTTL